MKSRILTLASLFVALSFSGVFAQLAQDDITASANVVTALEITKNDDVLFGNVGQGTTVTLNPTTGDFTNAGGTAELGKFTINGNATTSITVVFPSSVTLTDGSGSDLTWAPALGRTNDEEAEFGSTSLAVDGSFELSGEDFIFVGGELTVPADAAVALHQATVTMTVSYD